MRYILFSDRGVLQGILTKKDLWYVLNGAEETRRTEGVAGVVNTGLMREDGDGEEEGLLRGEDEGHANTPNSPGERDLPIL